MGVELEVLQISWITMNAALLEMRGAMADIRFHLSGLSYGKQQSIDEIKSVSFMRPNVRANRPAEASTVSLVRDDAPSAADQAYGACRSGSGGSARG